MTTEDPIPRTREQWQYCIEHWCGIELTSEYVKKRIQALDNPNDEHTRKFIECYGSAHHQRVLEWFRQALT